MSTVVPGAIIIGSAFAGLVGYGSSVGIFSLGLIAGITNTMLPRFRFAKKGREEARVRGCEAARGRILINY